MTYTATQDHGRTHQLAAKTLIGAKQECSRRGLVNTVVGVKISDGGVHLAYHAPTAKSQRAHGEIARWRNL